MSATIAVRFGNETSTSQPTEGTIVRSRIRSSGVGIRATRARLEVRGSTVEANAASATHGIAVIDGTTALLNSVVRGWSESGIATSPLVGEAPIQLSLDGVEIHSCRFGVLYHGGVREGRFSLRRSRVSGTDLGVGLRGAYVAADLGTVASPGANQIDVASGFAFQVSEGQPGVVVDAHGTTLNGRTFEGEIVGPAELPGSYQIAASKTVRF